jgi:hypothetical protein
VAKLQLSRTDLSNPQLTANDVQASRRRHRFWCPKNWCGAG